MLKNRMNGLILGTLAGDCLGSPYVYMKSDALFAQSRNVCWEVSSPGACGQLLMQSVAAVARHGMCVGVLEGAYRRYADSGREIDCALAMWTRHGEKNVDGLCGSQLLVRTIPIVIAGLCWDRETLFAQIAEQCRITHDDPVAEEFAQIYGLCLQGILNGKRRVEIWDELFDAVQSQPVRSALLSSYYERPCADGSSFHRASVAFGHALYHFWHNTPFVSALRSVILSGGATDVNAAATGALLGACQGVGAIPGAWLETMFSQPTFGDDTAQMRATLRHVHDIVANVEVPAHPVWHSRRLESTATHGMGQRQGRTSTPCVHQSA